MKGNYKGFKTNISTLTVQTFCKIVVIYTVINLCSNYAYCQLILPQIATLSFGNFTCIVTLKYVSGKCRHHTFFLIFVIVFDV